MHLITEIAKAVGWSATDVHVSERPTLAHQSNRLYDVRVDGAHYIAKEFLKFDELDHAPAREFGALVRLEPFDIAPRPVFFDPDIAPVVLYEFVDGEMWDRTRPSHAELARLARAWLAMHDVSVQGMWASRGHETPLQETMDRIERKLHAYAEWTSGRYILATEAAHRCMHLLQSARETAAELSVMAAVFCFCKGDPRFANVIRRPNSSLALVDWEDCGLRDPARDIADMMTHPNQEDLVEPHEWAHFLQPYLAARHEADPALMKRVHLYLGLFPLWWLSNFLTTGIEKALQGTLSGWTINGLPAEERLCRMLARALAWPEELEDMYLDRAGGVRFFPTHGEESSMRRASAN